MKSFSTLVLFAALLFSSIFTVHAQTTDSLWLQSNGTAYKTGETVTVTINAISATLIQGFTTQIRYDPACLQPINSTSPIAGMNGLAVPQTAGMADISFASTTPQITNGVLAEVRFTALKGCQTNLAIESAALVVRNESGFAASIPGIKIDQNAVALNIDSAMGNPQPAVSGSSVLSLVPTTVPETKHFNWQVVVWLGLAGIIILIAIGLYKFAGLPEQ